MKRRSLKLILSLLIIFAISFIAFIGFSSRLDALNRGRWHKDEFGDINGCILSGEECDWGAPEPD